MNLIIFGAPGSGKGTQSDNLAKDFNLVKISTGDLLRNEIDKRSELGKKIKDTLDGKLQPLSLEKYRFYSKPCWTLFPHIYSSIQNTHGRVIFFAR